MIGLSDPFTISTIDPVGLAARLGLAPGERILEINGVVLHDEIDFGSQISEEELTLLIRGRSSRRLARTPFGLDPTRAST